MCGTTASLEGLRRTTFSVSRNQAVQILDIEIGDIYFYRQIPGNLPIKEVYAIGAFACRWNFAYNARTGLAYSPFFPQRPTG